MALQEFGSAIMCAKRIVELVDEVQIPQAEQLLSDI